MPTQLGNAVEAWVDADGSGVYMTGPVELISDLVVSLKKDFAQGVPLFFADDGLSIYVDVSKIESADELLEAIDRSG
jgi:hypothetical protein